MPADPSEPPGLRSGDDEDGPDGAESGSDAGTKSLMRSSAVMAAGTFVSRILGMGRAVVLAWAIGTGLSGDAFQTANTLPNNLFILIGGGVLNAVLVPQIVRATRRADGGREYVDRLLTISVALLAGATLLVTALSPVLIAMLGGGWRGAQLALAVGFALWCVPQVFFYGLYTLLGQVLNARGNFGPYMWAPAINNVVAMAGMVIFVALWGSGHHDATWWTPERVAVLGGTATLGVAAQALILLPVLRRSGFRWRPRWGLRGVGLRTTSRVAGWTFAAVLVGQLGYFAMLPLANRAGAYAAHRGGAPNAGSLVYGNAYLLFMLPHSLIAVSLVTAVFTRMSANAGAGRIDAVRDDLSLSLRTVGVATVLATAAFLVLGRDLARGMFVGTPRAATDSMALVASAMVLGLVAFSAQYLFQRVFYSFEDARTPFIVQVVTIGVWTLGNQLSSAFLPPSSVVVGIGASMAVSNVIGAGFTFVLLRRRMGGLDGRRVLGTHARMIMAAGLASAVGWLARTGIHGLAGDSRLTAYLSLVVGGALMIATYAGVLRLLRVRELEDLLQPLIGRFGRRAET